MHLDTKTSLYTYLFNNGNKETQVVPMFMVAVYVLSVVPISGMFVLVNNVLSPYPARAPAKSLLKSLACGRPSKGLGIGAIRL